MRNILLVLAGIIILSACESESNKSSQRAGNPNLKEVVVKEVIHTSSYTYLNLKEESDVYWAAISRNEGDVPRNEDIIVGNTYYFDNFIVMEDFPSKELDKTFDKIYFIQVISDKPILLKDKNNVQQPQKTGSVNVGNMEIEPMEEVEGGITISELYANKEQYEGKIIKIRGIVVKYSEAIMNKNWIHIQDGTANGGDFDLTITTQSEVKVSDIATLEGVVVLNKDFGHGYSYDLILEEAKLVDLKKSTSLQ